MERHREFGHNQRHVPADAVLPSLELPLMMRYLKYCALALCACFGSSAFADVLTVHRPAFAVVRVLASVGDLYGAQAARLELTLAQWRTGGESTGEVLKSNLRASSNHFVMASANAGVEEYEGLSPA